jgi:hypothetical protein
MKREKRREGGGGIENQVNGEEDVIEKEKMMDKKWR